MIVTYTQVESALGIHLRYFSVSVRFYHVDRHGVKVSYLKNE